MNQVPNISIHDLVQFHAQNKYLLMAHDPARAKALGRVVANAKLVGVQEAARIYGRMYLACLAVPTSVGKHVNVLLHMAGYLRGLSSLGQRDHVLRAIRDYRDGARTHDSVVEMLLRHALVHDIEYLHQQTYFSARAMSQ